MSRRTRDLYVVVPKDEGAMPFVIRGETNAGQRVYAGEEVWAVRHLGPLYADHIPYPYPAVESDAPPEPVCDHGLSFDEDAAKGLSTISEIRNRWPRLFGPCPKGCGFNGIAYASRAHYVFGDW